jgi:hypothetical protein
LVYHITRNLYLCATHEVAAKRSPTYFFLNLPFCLLIQCWVRTVKGLQRTEYQSFCPRIGSPQPLPRNRVCLPLGPMWWGVDTLACGVGGGRGTQFKRLDRKTGTLYTLWFQPWLLASTASLGASSPEIPIFHPVFLPFLVYAQSNKELFICTSLVE